MTLQAHGSIGADAGISPAIVAGTGIAGGRSVRLFNVKYSPNLGDGLLSEALENALREFGCDAQGTFSVDLAARTAYERGTSTRSNVLQFLSALPGPVRRQAVRVPLALMLQRRWQPHYVENLDGAHALVVGGGNLFSDMDLNFPTKIVAALELAAQRALPSAIYGVGVADGWSETGLAMMRKALSAARPFHVSVRDEASKRRFDAMFAASAGKEAKVVRDPGLLVSRYVAVGRKPEPRPVGLCITSPIAVSYHSDRQGSPDDFARFYCGLAQRLGDDGRQVTAFTNGSPEDEQFLDAIDDELRRAAGKGFRRAGPRNPTELATLVAGFELLVAHRMHALIAAYSYGVPIFALSWDAKVDAFMASIGQPERIAPADMATVAKIAAAAADRLAAPERAPPRRSVLDAALADVRGLAEAIADA